MHTIKIVI